MFCIFIFFFTDNVIKFYQLIILRKLCTYLPTIHPITLLKNDKFKQNNLQLTYWYVSQLGKIIRDISHYYTHMQYKT